MNELPVDAKNDRDRVMAKAMECGDSTSWNRRLRTSLCEAKRRLISQRFGSPIALWRLTQSLYSVCQFAFVYFIVDPKVTADYVVCLASLGFVQLFDFTLSTNVGAFRLQKCRDEGDVAMRIAAASILYALSSTFVAVGIYSYYRLCVGTSIPFAPLFFFVLVSVYNALSNATVLFTKFKNTFLSILKTIIVADLAGFVVFAGMVYVNRRASLLVLIGMRLAVLAGILIKRLPRRKRSARLRVTVRWWRQRLIERRKFLGFQILSVAAGILLFAVPQFSAFHLANPRQFAAYAMALAMTNFVVTYFSSYFGANTEDLVQVLGIANRGGTSNRLFPVIKLTLIPFGAAASAVVVAVIAARALGLPMISAKLNSLPTLLLVAIMASGYFRVCAQVLAIAQRMYAQDTFILPSLVLGALNVLLIKVLATGVNSLVAISVAISIAGYAFGALRHRPCLEGTG